MKEEDFKLKVKCADCGKILGYLYEDFWLVNVPKFNTKELDTKFLCIICHKKKENEL